MSDCLPTKPHDIHCCRVPGDPCKGNDVFGNLKVGQLFFTPGLEYHWFKVDDISASMWSDGSQLQTFGDNDRVVSTCDSRANYQAGKLCEGRHA